MEDLHSSDVEAQPQANPFAKAGSSVVQKILDNASELRLSSKKDFVERTPYHGAPGTNKLRARWVNAWEGFLGSSLKKSLDAYKPTGEDIGRFLLSQPQAMTARMRDEFGWITFQNGLRHVLQAVAIRHASFKLTPAEKDNLKQVFQTMVDKRLLTKAPVREKQWVVAKLALSLCTALLNESLVLGTFDWNGTISRCLSLSLASALTARAGDITLSDNYSIEAYLTYEDIKMRVSSSDSLEDVRLEAEITLRYTKGAKQDPSKNHVVRLDSLQRTDLNPVCPLKLLLILALRTQSVSATSLDQLLQDTIARRDRTVQWSRPRRPVLCKLNSCNRLLLDDPAPTSQLNKNLNKAAGLTGIMEHLTSHDMRRGGASDANQLKDPGSMTHAAAALNHTSTSMGKGITKQYAGHSKKSTFAERFELEDDSFGLQTVSVPLKRKRNAKKEEVDAYMKDNAASLTNLKNPRETAAKRLRKEKADAELQAFHASPIPLSETSSLGATSAASITSHAGQTRAEDQITLASASTSSLSPNESLDGEHASSTGPYFHQAASTSHMASDHTVTDGDLSGTTLVEDDLITESDHNGARSPESLAIDPQLLKLSDVLTGHCSDITMDVLQTEDDVLNSIDAAQTAAAFDVHKILAAPARQFISHFSAINMFRVSNENKSLTPPSFLIGGSRDNPTPYHHRCYNHDKGCTYKHPLVGNLNCHEAKCSADGIERLRQLGLSRISTAHELVCDIEGCGQVLRGDTIEQARNRLSRHKKVHTWVPADCQVGGFDACKTMFATSAMAQKHKNDYHSKGWIPQRCALDSSHTTVFDRLSGLEKHYRGPHNKSLDETQKLIDKARGGQKNSDWTPAACSIGGAKGCDTIFQTKEEYQKHKRHHTPHVVGTCTVGGYDACSKVIANNMALRRHKAQFHAKGWSPRTCALDPKHRKLFMGLSNLRTHYQTQHDKTGKELEDLLPFGKRFPGGGHDDGNGDDCDGDDEAGHGDDEADAGDDE